MANILAIRTVGVSRILEVDADPSAGGGTVAPKGSFASVNDGSGMYLKTGVANTSWIKFSSADFPVARYVYLVQDASDQARMGGITNNAHTTFQAAYDAANTLQLALGGTERVVICVGNTTAAAVGNVILTANWNENVWMNGLSLLESEVGNITGDTAAGTAFSVGRTIITQQVRFSNIKVGNISVSATGATGNSGSIGLVGSNFQVGNLNTNITNVANTLGLGGAIRFLFNINNSALIIGNIVTSGQSATGTSGSLNILGSTITVGTITTANGGLGGNISISPSSGGSIGAISMSTLSATGVSIQKCTIASISLTLSGGSCLLTQCISGGTTSVLGTIVSSATLTNCFLSGVVSNSFVTMKVRNTSMLSIDSLGDNSVLLNCSIDGGTYCIKGIGTNCFIIGTALKNTSGLSIDNTAGAVTVFSDVSTFVKAVGANITISVIGGVFPLADSAGTFAWSASLYKQASINLAGSGGGPNTLSFNNPAIGETYVLYVTNTTGIDTLSITGAIYSGGTYMPTVGAGAKDRLLITYDGTSLWVVTAGTNFS